MIGKISNRKKNLQIMKKKHKKPLRDFVFSFGKAQLSAFIGGLFDFLVYTLGIQIVGLSAYLANIVSGSLGAVVNFSINRYWTFQSTEVSLVRQLRKFVVVVVGSISLKSAGIYILVDQFNLNAYYSKLAVEALVSLGFNFLLQKYWVFKNR